MRIKSLLMMLALGVFSSSASAAMVLVGLYTGPGTNDGNATQLEALLLSGDNQIAPNPLGLIVDLQEEARVNVIDLSAGSETNGGLTITGTVFKPDPADSDEAIAGTWDWTGAGSLDYLTIKFDNWLAVYDVTGSMPPEDWSTKDLCTTYGACNDNNQPFEISHSAGYSVVPVPAAVWLFASGLLGLVGYARKKA